MPTIESKVDFEVFCGTCGFGLCKLTEVQKGIIYVQACPKCLENAKSDGFDEGFEQGKKEGYA